MKQQVDLSYTDPYFLGMPIAAGIDLFATQATQQSSGAGITSYGSTVVGGALRTGFELDEFSSVNFKYYIAHRSVSGIDGAKASPFALAAKPESWKSAISASYTYDDLDNPLKPTSGFRGQIIEELAGLGGDAYFAKTEIRAYYFVPLFDEQVVVKLEGNAGHIQPLSSNQVESQDRFFKGGDTFRGFSNGGIGPRQVSNAGGFDRIGALDYAIGTVEANFPLGLPEALGISGEVFSDFGTVFNAGSVPPLGGSAGCGKLAPGCAVTDDNGLRASIGAGLVWESPFGTLKFEYAYPVLSRPSDDLQYFRFAIGTRF